MGDHRRAAQTGAAGLLLVMASCAAPATRAPAPEPVPAPSVAVSVVPARSAADAAGQAAVAAYVGMWQAMARAGQTADWRSPELDHYATGLAHASITRSLYADHLDHVVTRGAPTNAPVVRSVQLEWNPARVLIEDCGDSTNSLKYHQGTDQLAGEGPGGGHRAIHAEVLRQPDGTWRVNRFAVQGMGTC